MAEIEAARGVEPVVIALVAVVVVVAEDDVIEVLGLEIPEPFGVLGKRFTFQPQRDLDLPRVLLPEAQHRLTVALELVQAHPHAADKIALIGPGRMIRESQYGEALPDGGLHICLFRPRGVLAAPGVGVVVALDGFHNTPQ